MHSPEPLAIRALKGALFALACLLLVIGALARAGVHHPLGVLLDPAPIGLACGIGAAVAFGALIPWRAHARARWRHGTLWILVAASAGVAISCALISVLAYQSEEVRFESAGATLEGTLYTPRGQGPYPLVVMVHGSGPETRKEYAFYARLFAREGVAGFAYDKRGSGESGGDVYGTDYAGYAQDVIAAIESLAQRQDIDPARIGLMGISEAEWVGPIAMERSGRIAFAVIQSPAGTSPAAQVAWEMEHRLRTQGYPEEAVQDALEVNELLFSYQRTGERAEELERELARVSAEPWFPESELPPQVYSFEEYAWWRSVMDFDPGPLWAGVSVPVLVIKGGNDDRSSAEGAQQAISSAAGAGKIEFVIYPDADHGILEREGSALPRFPQGYLDTLVGWVLAQAQAAGQ